MKVIDSDMEYSDLFRFPQHLYRVSLQEESGEGVLRYGRNCRPTIHTTACDTFNTPHECLNFFRHIPALTHGSLHLAGQVGMIDKNIQHREHELLFPWRQLMYVLKLVHEELLRCLAQLPLQLFHGHVPWLDYRLDQVVFTVIFCKNEFFQLWIEIGIRPWGNRQEKSHVRIVMLGKRYSLRDRFRCVIRHAENE